MTEPNEIKEGDGRTPKPLPKNLVDKAGDDSFPVSDPPASTGVSGSGAPKKKQDAAPAPSDGELPLMKWLGTGLMAVAAAVTLSKLQRRSRRR